MPTVRLAPTAGILYQAFTVGGLPLNAGLLYTYIAGGTTPLATYTTSAGNIQNANPIVLGADGRPANEVWLTQGVTYRFDLKDSLGNLIQSFDNITGINDIAAQLALYLPLTGGTVTGSTTFSGGLVVTGGGSISGAAFNAADDVFFVVGSLDATKKIRHEADNITAGATRVWTAQDKNGTVALTADTPPRSLANVGFSVAMAASACTITLTQSDGTSAPTTGNPVSVGYRSTTITSSASSTVSTTATIATVISNGSTGGTVSAVASRIWVAGILTGGATEIAWFNAGSQTNGTFFDEGALISTTAEGGAGAADSQGVWYSTTARASVPFTILGYFDSTQATAGTWATSVTDIVVNPRYTPVRTINLGTPQASTSGTSIDFTSIPAGVRRITVNLVGVSTNGTSNRLFQIGTGGTPLTSTYLGSGQVSGTGANFTTGFGINSSSAADVLHMTLTLMLENSSTNTWVASGLGGLSNTGACAFTSGSVSLSGALDIVRCTTANGTDAFDAGAINITYE